MSRQPMTPEGKHPGEETLSAYWDRELTPGERSRVEAHLSHCEQCRRVLSGYERLSRALRDEPVVAVPARLDHEFRARLSSPPRSSRWTFLPAMGSLAAAALLFVFASTFIAPGSPTPLASAYPSRNATAVALTAAVEIAYPPGVDKATVEQAVNIEPPVKVRKEWRGDTLVLTPQEPLAPGTTYSVKGPRVEAQSAAPALPVLPQPTPRPEVDSVVTTFTTAPAAVAQAQATPEATQAPEAPPPAPAAAVLSSAITPTPVSYPSAAPSVAALAPGPSVAAVAPAGQPRVAEKANGPLRDLNSLLEQPATLLADLGQPTGPARLVNLAEQSFAGGRLLWREDERSIIALFAGGRWESFADTYIDEEDAAAADAGGEKETGTPVVLGANNEGVVPLATATAAGRTPSPAEPRRGFGKVWNEHEEVRKNLEKALSPERGFTGAVQSFAKGTVFATDRRSVYVVYDDGRWQELAFFGTVATPVRPQTPVPASATPKATAKPGTPAPRATATPAPGSWGEVVPVPMACPATVVRGFGLVYADPLVRARLGCPIGPEEQVLLAEQSFQDARMLWRGDNKSIYVLASDGSFRTFVDAYVEGEEQPAPTPPAGMVAPARGFGKVWRDSAAVRESAGWATGKERGFTGAVQEFTGGTMLWLDGDEVLVLFADGRWERHPDLFED